MICLLQLIYLYVYLCMLKDSDIIFEWQNLLHPSIFGLFIYIQVATNMIATFARN